MDENNLITVIMPTYNSENEVRASVISVLNQTHENLELIIIDDASNDSTIKVLSTIKDSRLKVIKQRENKGAAESRNRGLKEAKGRFIAFIDSDDFWKENKLEVQLDIMINNNYGFTYTDYTRIDENENNIGYVKAKAKINYTDLLKNTIIGCSTVMIDKKIVGDFTMPLLRKGQDTATWLMLLKDIEYAFGINENLTIYKVRKGSISSNKVLALKRTWNIYRKTEKIPLMKSCYYFTFYVYNAIKKRMNFKGIEQS